MADSFTVPMDIDPPLTPPIPVRSPASTSRADPASSGRPTTPSGEETTEQVLSLEHSPAGGAELGGELAELRRLRFLGRYGDYAGRVVKTVHEVVPKTLPSSVVDLKKGLEREVSANPHRGGKLYQTLETAANILSERGYSIDVKMIELAIDAYSARNEAFHSELVSAKVAKDTVRVSGIVTEDLGALASLLPGAELEDLQSWRKIITFYAKRQDEQVLEGNRSTVLATLRSKASLAEADKNRLDWRWFRQTLEQDSGATSGRQRSPSDPTPMSSALKRKACQAFSGEDETARAGEDRGLPRRKPPTKKLQKLERLLEAYQAAVRASFEENPRRALQRMEQHVAEVRGSEPESSKGK